MSTQTHPTTTPFEGGTILGYPRIGRRRELKRALEAHWAGRTSADELEAAARDLRLATLRRLVELGLDPADGSVPGSFSYYDQVLDAAVTLGALPARFGALASGVAPLHDGGTGVPLSTYFALARGSAEQPPLEMTKWFDTNYHYLVPEIGPGTRFRLTDDRVVREHVEARGEGVVTRPVVVGPVTFLLLSKPADDAPEGFRPLDRLDDLLVAYRELLHSLAEARAPWVQLDEPGLVSDTLIEAAGATRDEVAHAVNHAYTELAVDLGPGVQRPRLLVAAPYGDLDRPGAAAHGPAQGLLATLAETDVEAIAIDLVRGSVPSGPVPGLEHTTLVAGVVDGHGVWRADLAARLELLEGLRARTGARDVVVGTSTSLLHVPHDVEDETWEGPDAERAGRFPELRTWLAFADQKVREVTTLARGLVLGRDAVARELAAASEALASRAAAPGVVVPSVRERLAGLDEAAFTRGRHAERVAAQRERLQLPPLPTTTIGSFPQTPEIRTARAAWTKGELDDAAYAAAMRAEVERVVRLQEELGLDVLVHGEPERNDMVQYFAEQLDGFATTQLGWVQSYGSRCVRPPILWGDVSRSAPMTVEWATYAQSLTSKPVKGMLTGPVTILAWSFVRDDQPVADTANQVALALRDEVTDLEDAGIAVVQVDEPALRELLPLRREDQGEYLRWSVGSFRLATAGARPATQVHTHLCYSEFGDVIGAIDGLDADVTSLEAARSRMEIVPELRAAGYARGIGPGVYDIHSPRVPSVEEVTELLRLAVAEIDPGLVWVNPDCGLKTRRYEEVTPALRNLVEAARTVRATLLAPAKDAAPVR
ncbi:5-methyltetrahydropteroyltriglutamate--homocysteine S-methyltransferase [Isoptericola variabilis]|uniref:5-methyltetrahydropteroyltriglutamate--homocysteine methyltransferase n=1 Tax=Isoptericola variabilis (strain 225) TaxID=743718 RepID=F6FQR7_ISOV2|nr:5-methyltetrahydropteroyltriglutamate--homocysteine S-methyltransferase [Isoptericola variabilis]AEG42882.1 5-methyltetrahydropteroyltriglutamate--homocysteine methyltransferase [Isoptericola variabilis 225]